MSTFYRDIVNKLFPRANTGNKILLALSLLYGIGIIDARYANPSSAVTNCVGITNIYCIMYLTMYGMISITNICVYVCIVFISILCLFPLVIMGFLKMLELHNSFGLIGLLPSVMVALLKILDVYKELSIICLLPLVILGLAKVMETKEYYENMFKNKN